MMNITFKPLAESDFPRLLTWLQAPHVKAWWDQDVKWTLDLVQEKYGSYVKGYKIENRTHKKINAYIIHVGGLPIGYIQAYNAYDFSKTKPLTGLPKKLAAFDIFIGEQDYLRQGIGPRALQQFLDTLCDGGYTHVFANPNTANIAAIKAYGKAGFKSVQEYLDTNETWMLKAIEIPTSEAVSTKTASHFLWGDRCEGWWLKKGGAFTVISERMPEGASEIRHFHQQTEQFFYVLEGELTLELEGVEHKLTQGDSIIVKPCASHRAFNNSHEDVRFLVVSCPDSHEDRVDLIKDSHHS